MVAATTRPLFGPADPEIVANVKRGLLRLTPKQYAVAKMMLSGMSRDQMKAQLFTTLGALDNHIAVVLAKCECTRYQFARACMELDTDPEVVDYLTALPRKHGRFRAMFAKD